MKTTPYFALSLLAAAVMTACSSLPNQALTDAHGSYNDARSNAAITSLAPIELKDASDSLAKADAAFADDDDAETVSHLAYLAQQQVAIAQETAKRKQAEAAITASAAKRTQVQLTARTAEADAAHVQVANDQVLIAQLRAMNAQQTERGMVITLGDVLFSTNRAQLKSGGVRNVQLLADFMGQYPQYKVSVEGHTDSVGSDAHNQALSERRAEAVQATLVGMGISSDRAHTHSYGEGYPVASNRNADGRQLNRRVEIVLSDENGNIAPHQTQTQ